MRKPRLNAVCRKLEKGNGSIAGMQMLLPVEDTCLVQVTVRGIDFGHWARSGVSVIVEPRDGAGHLCVDAPKLVDDTPRERARYFAKSQAAKYVRDHKPRRESSDRDWRSCITGCRAKLTDEQRDLFDREAAQVLQKKPIGKAGAYELEKLLPLLAQVAFDLMDDDVPDED